MAQRERFMPFSETKEEPSTNNVIEMAQQKGFVKAEIGTQDKPLQILVNLEDRIAIPIPMGSK